MTLFSTLSEPYVLLLFLYLGAVSGLIFYFARFLFSFLDRRKLLAKDLLKDEKKTKKGGIKNKNNLLKDKKEQKDILKQKNEQLMIEKKKIDKILLEEKRQEKRKMRKIRQKEFFIKTGKVLLAGLIKLGQLISQTGKFVIFVGLVFVTYLCNLKLNYGEINIVCIVAYIFAFFLAGYFLNLLAKFFVAFYTENRKTKKKQDAID